MKRSRRDFLINSLHSSPFNFTNIADICNITKNDSPEIYPNQFFGHTNRVSPHFINNTFDIFLRIIILQNHGHLNFLNPANTG